MGQPVTVIEKQSSKPGVVRFETNRVLTGTGIETYRAGRSIYGTKWCDELARRLFAHGGVDTVSMNGSVVTVHLAGGQGAGLKDIVEEMFIYYRPGVEVVIPGGAAAE